MTQGRKKVEGGTPLLGNDKNIVIVNYLSYFFLLKLSELNGYLKGYLKPRINKLPKKKKIFLLANTDLLKICLLSFLINIARVNVFQFLLFSQNLLTEFIV